MNEYVFACFVFLASGGHHSYFEVMSVVKQMIPDLNPEHYFQLLEMVREKAPDLYYKYSEQFAMFTDAQNDVRPR